MGRIFTTAIFVFCSLPVWAQTFGLSSAPATQVDQTGWLLRDLIYRVDSQPYAVAFRREVDFQAATTNICRALGFQTVRWHRSVAFDPNQSSSLVELDETRLSVKAVYEKAYVSDRFLAVRTLICEK